MSPIRVTGFGSTAANVRSARGGIPEWPEPDAQFFERFKMSAETTRALRESSEELSFRERDQWPNIEDLAKGYDDFLPPQSSALQRRSFSFSVGLEARRIDTVHFDGAGAATWAGSNGDPAAAVPVDVFELRPAIFYVSLPAQDGQSERTLVIDDAGKQGWMFESELFENERGTRTRTDIHPVGFDGAKPEPLVRSSNLVGKHALHVYNDRDWYEHFYLNKGTFSWHCLRGIEEGTADTEKCCYFEVAEGLFILHWTESNLPVESVILIDFANRRSVGRFFCWEKKVDRVVRMVFGAYPYIATELQYPEVSASKKPMDERTA